MNDVLPKDAAHSRRVILRNPFRHPTSVPLVQFQARKYVPSMTELARSLVSAARNQATQLPVFTETHKVGGG